MRLLNTTTLRLETFDGEPPPYAILSHRWTEDELLFDDVQQEGWELMLSTQGAEKTKKACRQALQDELEYLWIDTCCIDKSSSAELSEAINSMFVWYNEAVLCYAYLADVDATASGFFTGIDPSGMNFGMDGLRSAFANVGAPKSGFEASAWFQRGWTLQELIAPETLIFYDRDWNPIGTRNDLDSLIFKITGIEEEDLSRFRPAASTVAPTCNYMQLQRADRSDSKLRAILDSYSVAARLSWAAKRKTTRTEDLAYSLLGLFNVNIPLLYGEGEKAFQRLLQEIVRQTGDPTVLVAYGRTPFFQSPSSYTDCGNVVWLEAQGMGASTVSLAKSGALALEALIGNCNIHGMTKGYKDDRSILDRAFVVAVLDCVFSNSESRLGLIFRWCQYHKVYEQYYSLPLVLLEALGPQTVVGTMGSQSEYSVTFSENQLSVRRIEVAFSETHRVTQRKADLLVDPLSQPPNFRYVLRKSQLFADEPTAVNDVNVFVVEDNKFNGFFLLWGYTSLAPENTASQHVTFGGVDQGTRERPWCRVLPLENPVGVFSKGETSISGEPNLRVLNRSPVKLGARSAGEPLLWMINRFRARSDSNKAVDLGDVIVQASFNPKTFLGITSYRLALKISPATDELRSELERSKMQIRAPLRTTPRPQTPASMEIDISNVIRTSLSQLDTRDFMVME